MTKKQRRTIKRSFNISEAYSESLDQNQPSVNEVNVRLRKLTEDYGDFEIINQETENAATDEEAEQEYRQRELLNEKYFFIEAAFQTYVTEKNQAIAHTSGSSEYINNSYIYALAQNQARLSEIVDRLSSQSPPGSVGNTTVNLPTVSIPIFNGNYLEWTSFHNLFVSLIHNNEKLTTSQKLHHLKSSLKGDAASSLKHLSVNVGSYEPTTTKTLLYNLTSKTTWSKNH
jgi:hypothetical protein